MENTVYEVKQHEVEDAAEQLKEYITGAELDAWKPGPSCYVRYRVKVGKEVIIGHNWWMGRKEAYLGLWTALNAIRAYLQAQRKENDD